MTNKRVLLISGSIGLGHAGRDVAIARALRDINPNVKISWLAGDPARHLIADAGEALLPEAEQLGNESASAENHAGEFSLNIARYASRVRSVWERNVATFDAVTSKYDFDVVIGDETYELVGAFAKRPELKRTPFVMIYDFVGLDAASWNPFERFMVYMANRAWSGGRKARPPLEDLTLMVGEPEDVPDRPFGFMLPNRRDYATRHYEFLGYVFPFDPSTFADGAEVRRSLGYDERPLVFCSIGGTAVGRDLLELCGKAFPHMQDRISDLQMVAVLGPRLDRSTVSLPPEVEVLGYVPRLYEHFAASDLAIVQSGGTTTLELTALRRPFIYFPLEDHFEQEVMVGGRLARHQAGRKLRFSETSPSELAEAATQLIGSTVDWPAIPSDGAAVAAQLINKLL